MRIRLSVGLAALFIPALLVAAARAQAPGGPPPSVTVAKPVVKDVVEYDEFTGRFEATELVDVRARVSGYLEKVAFTDGAIVKKGDVLFVIDRRPYKSALEQAQSSVASAKAKLTFGQGDFERAQSLQKTGNIAEQLVDQRRQNFVSAQADLDSAQAALRAAQLNYDFTEVRSPIAGRISRRLISEGNLVNANDTLLTTIVTLDPIYFYFDVDERSYLTYSRTIGLERSAGKDTTYTAMVAVTDEREPKRPAKLDFLDNRLDQASGTIRARAVVENKDLFLVPGLFGRIAVAGSTPQRGVLVPDEAIATDQDRRFVWTVAEDGTVGQAVVRPGPRIDGYRLVRRGLKGDETIVVNGLQRVRPGIKVKAELKELPAAKS